MIASTTSFARDAGPERAFDAHQHVLGLLLQHRLRGQHVLDLGGADAEGQRAERTVRAGVRIAAHHRHPGQRRALLRADHVDDALALVEEREVRGGAALADVRVERDDLLTRDRVVDAIEPLVPVGGRRVVVGGRDDRRHPPRLASGQSQTFERLRTRDFVHQVTVDVQHRRAIRLGVHDVFVPQLVVQRARRGHAKPQRRRRKLAIMPPEQRRLAARGHRNLRAAQQSHARLGADARRHSETRP